MRSLQATGIGVATCVLGALIGFFAPAAASSIAGSSSATVGAIAAAVVGLALVAWGLHMAVHNRAVAFASGLWPMALVSTGMIFLIAYAGGMP